MKLIAIFYISLTYLVAADPIEVKLEPGSYVMAYFSTPGNPDLLTPVTKFSHALPRFAHDPAVLTIDLKVGGDKPVLHLNRNMEKYKIAPCNAWFNLVDNKSFQFGDGVSLCGVSVRKEGESLVIIQKFKHVSKKVDNELVIVVSPSKDWFGKNIKVPESFMLWNWEFSDTFDYLDIALRAKE